MLSIRPGRRRDNRTPILAPADTLDSVDRNPKEFRDVTIYTPSDLIFPNIVRIDARVAKIWIGTLGLHTGVVVEYIEKGKRTRQTFVSSEPYVVVVPTAAAIKPDELWLPPISGTSSTRYSVSDPRWRTDFEQQLRSANIPILADYREPFSKEDTGGTAVTSPISGGGQVPIRQSNPAPGSEFTQVDREYDEGLRHQAERKFFKRNPGLIQEAKATYGCTCQVCGFDFEKTYGALGSDFAEGHHMSPLSERASDEWTTPIQTSIADIAVLCSNCHSMIHRRRPALSIEELRATLARQDLNVFRSPRGDR